MKLLSGLTSECAVENQGETGEWFNIRTGVKQGCNMSSFMFLLVMDWILRRTTGNGENGIKMEVYNQTRPFP